MRRKQSDEKEIATADADVDEEARNNCSVTAILFRSIWNIRAIPVTLTAVALCAASHIMTKICVAVIMFI